MSTHLSTAREWQWPTNLAGYEDDLRSLLAGSVSDEGILGYAEPPTPAQANGFAAGLSSAVASGSGHVLLGSDSSGIVAMCVMSVSSMPNCRHIAEVSKAYLRPSVRGTRALLELTAQVCEKAQETGVEMLVIDVRQGSKAHRVWEHLEFRTFGVLPDYSRVNGEKFPGCYMYHEVADLAAIVAAKLDAQRRG
jgi:L-amino acid N-acyltransferase YncA